MVRAYVAGRKPEIWVEAGRGPPQVFIPQAHQPGQDAEVDFGDVCIDLAGVRTLCYMFVFRLSFSGKAVHRVSASEGQEAFFEGHAHAFSVLGGVPAGKVRYDNLTSAVARVLGFTRARVETDRWTAFRSWAGLDAFYCQPGLQGAHEKGGVEGEVGRFRRNHLVPVPQVSTLAELNALLDVWDQEDEGRRIADRTRTVGEFFAIERPLLAPLPPEAFETGRVLTPRVDRYAQVTVRMNRYSVPAGLIGRQVRVLLHASDLVVYDGRAEVARHERMAGRGGSRLDLDHYLEGLLRKPGALPGATVLEQARAAGRFTPVHDAWWAAARTAHGDAAGTRALAGVLLLHRRMAHEHVVAGIAAALRAGAMTADVVAMEARKAADAGPPDAAAQPEGIPRPSPVASLTGRRLAALPADSRPLPSVAAYDQLLRRPRPPATRSASQGDQL
jgi:transposase